MSLPIAADLKELTFAFEGLPFVYISAKDKANTSNLLYALEGLPIQCAIGPTSPIATSDLLDLSIGKDGLPFMQVSGKQGINTFDLSYGLNALPNFAPFNGPLPITIIGVCSIETIVSAEVVTAHSYVPNHIGEPGNLLDTMTFKVRVLMQEFINSLDVPSIFAGARRTEFAGMRLRIAAIKDENSGTRTAIGAAMQEEYGTNIVISQNFIIPVTDVLSLANPYQPTIYINGTPIVTNTATDPGSTEVTLTQIYIHWLSTGVDGNDWTDLYNFSFTLNYADGNFNIVSKRPPEVEHINFGANPIALLHTYFTPTAVYGAFAPTSIDAVAQAHLGKQVNIFGFIGTITDFGAGISDSQAAYISQGIFGNPFMHTQLNLLLTATALLGSLGTNQTLNPTASSVGGDCASLARTVARAAGSNLLWAIQNVPMQNTFKLDGQTAIQAINSLASMSGGVLRWDGNNSYVVAYPDQYFGQFIIPDAKLLTSAGASYLQHYDLETGLSGVGMVLFPALNSGAVPKAIANPSPKQGATPALQRVGKLAKVLTSLDPPSVFDLPYNYDKVYIQVLVGAAGETGGVIQASPLNNFITKDPTEWFEFDVSHLSLSNDSYIFNAYLGDQYIPQVKVDANVFPQAGANTSIDGALFEMNLACSTKDLSALFNNARNNINETLANAINPLKFLKTYTGTISFQFYGALPLPGMWGKVTIPGGATAISYTSAGTFTDTIPITGGDFVVEGIIEEVQFTYPGIVTLSLAQYVRINYLENNPATITINTIGQQT